MQNSQVYFVLDCKIVELVKVANAVSLQVPGIYKTYDPFYPYWQSIGFMLQIYKGEDFAKKWLKYFKEPKIDFYLDRGFRDDWLYSSEWKIYYPKGLNI